MGTIAKVDARAVGAGQVDRAACIGRDRLHGIRPARSEAPCRQWSSIQRVARNEHIEVLVTRATARTKAAAYASRYKDYLDAVGRVPSGTMLPAPSPSDPADYKMAETCCDFGTTKSFGPMGACVVAGGEPSSRDVCNECCVESWNPPLAGLVRWGTCDPANRLDREQCTYVCCDDPTPPPNVQRFICVQGGGTPVKCDRPIPR